MANRAELCSCPLACLPLTISCGNIGTGYCHSSTLKNHGEEASRCILLSPTYCCDFQEASRADSFAVLNPSKSLGARSACILNCLMEILRDWRIKEQWIPLPRNKNCHACCIILEFCLFRITMLLESWFMFIHST